MSEEAKETQETTEGAPQAAKKKKMNQLSIDELNKKIAAMEESNLTLGKYYIHLKQRKKELESRNQ